MKINSPEPASTPIAQGGWRYSHEIDEPDFRDFTADELRQLEVEMDLDFSDHPALKQQEV